MANSFVGTPVSATSTGTNSFALSTPTGWTPAAGDLLVAWVSRRGAVNDVANASFTKDTYIANGGPGALTFLYRWCDGSEGSSYTFTWLTSGGAAGVLLAYRGLDAAIFDLARTGTDWGTAAMVLQDLTTVTANAWYLAAGEIAVSSAGGLFAPPGAMVERVDTGNSNSSNRATLGAFDEALGAAGSTGTRTVTSNANTKCSIATALRPASAAATKAPPPFQRRWRYLTRRRVA